MTHVLLVEDNPGDVRLVREWLREGNPTAFHIVHVARLAEALLETRRSHFDAVLLDLSLPDGHGLDTLRQFQAAAPHLPIVVLSGLHDEALALEAVRRGAQDYLVKGEEHGPAMARAVRYAIERKRGEEELRRARDQLEEHVAERTAALRAANRRLSEEIRERRHAEELAQRRQAELAHVARLSTMGQMATEIAHELNQPLFAIASYAEACLRLYKRRTREDCDELAQALQEVSKQAARAGQIIERIRRFVRKESPQRAPVELNQLVKDMVQLVGVEARAHNVKIRLALASGAVTVHGDSLLLQQVVVNLVRNAIEAMDVLPAGARRLTITTVEHEDRVELAVADSGPGLSPEQSIQVFEPFYTTKSHGMGMGLSISQSIIESHGGELFALPNAEGGTTFRFRLPSLDTRGESHEHERRRRHSLHSG